MSSSTVSGFFQRSANISRWLQSPFPGQVHGTPLAQLALAWAPYYVLLPSSQLEYFPFQDIHPYWPGIDHPVHHCSSHGGQHLSPNSELVLVSNACPQCQQQPKLPDHRFCSLACGQSAARSAPELKHLFPHHELFTNVATKFMKSWKSASVPKIHSVYMITWTESSQKSFEQYRDAVEARGQYRRMGLFSGNEQKQFRSTARACTLGEGGNLSLCNNEACRMCETIRWGFEPHLRRKRELPWNAGGIRLGAGIYTSRSSSKADQYAVNIHDPSSRIKAMLVCRVVIGKPYVMFHEDPTIRSPPAGYDCVSGQPGQWSVFVEDEYVVYDADTIRAAYLVLYETAHGA